MTIQAVFVYFNTIHTQLPFDFYFLSGSIKVVDEEDDYCLHSTFGHNYGGIPDY